MIPLIVTGGPPKAGLNRSGEADATEAEAGFADLLQPEAEDETQEATPDAVSLGVIAAPLPKVPEPDAGPQEGDTASPDPAEGAACAATTAQAGSLLAPQPTGAPKPDQGPPMNAIKAQLLVSGDESPIARPWSAPQGPAEIAMRAALQSEDAPDGAIVEVVDPAVITEAPDTQPIANPADTTLRQPEPLTPRNPAPVALHPAQVVAQIVSRAESQDDAVELLLAPEELGKLRFVIQQDGASVKISLTAERPETLDLLRRHADQLLQEFRQSGYSGATIDFGNWSGQGQQGQAAQAFIPEEAAVIDTIPDIPAISTPLAPGAQGLNLRL